MVIGITVFSSMYSVSQSDCISTIKDLEALLKKKDHFTVETIIKKPNNTGVTFLKHDNKKHYVVKQRLSSIPSRHMIAIRDALGSRIALDNDIPANCVVIIPRGYEFPGKNVTSFPATLHEVVPGVRVDRLPAGRRLPRSFIQQHIRKCNIYGLTRDIITNMSCHPDLCRIAALDTFIANGDRHTGNLFYDDVSNRYYAIDLASSFKYQAACYARDLISSMLKEKKCVLSKKAIEGLSIYRDTLKRLVQHCHPDRLYECMLNCAKQGDFITCPGVVRRVEDSKLVIKKNYESCRKLLLLLNTFIKKQRTRAAQ